MIARLGYRRATAAVALLLVVALGAGCSSSSGGSTGPTPSGSPSTAAVDRAGVTTILNEVLTGLRAATSVGNKTPLGDVAQSLLHASTSLAAAGEALNTTPAGVPQSVAVPIAIRLGRLGRLLHRASTCLTEQSGRAHPDPAPCLPPLRRAEANDAALAHQLISLAAYGQVSPQLFESHLVQALHGK